MCEILAFSELLKLGKTAVLPASAAPGLKEGEKGHHWRAFSAKMRASPARSEVLDRGRPR